jgi:hypothetical protein
MQQQQLQEKWIPCYRMVSDHWSAAALETKDSMHSFAIFVFCRCAGCTACPAAPDTMLLQPAVAENLATDFDLSLLAVLLPPSDHQYLHCSSTLASPKATLAAHLASTTPAA